jgi:copper resistance protein B
MDHHAMPGMAAAPSSPETPAEAPPPPAPADHAADRYYDPAAMAAARRTLRREHGGERYAKVTANLAEYQARDGGAYRWNGEAWYGGDIDRLVVKSEGEGARRGGLEAAEVQAMWSRALTPTFDLQLGLRQDFAPGPARTYGAVALQGVTPYWIEVEGALFVSSQGDLLARLEAAYDLRLTQRLVLQPRAELNFAAQDVAATRTGSGLADGAFGLRLRYEVTRRFAPYVGLSHERRFGRTAALHRMDGEGGDATAVVAGVAGWF